MSNLYGVVIYYNNLTSRILVGKASNYRISIIKELSTISYILTSFFNYFSILFNAGDNSTAILKINFNNNFKPFYEKIDLKSIMENYVESIGINELSIRTPNYCLPPCFSSEEGGCYLVGPASATTYVCLPEPPPPPPPTTCPASAAQSIYNNNSLNFLVDLSLFYKFKDSLLLGSDTAYKIYTDYYKIGNFIKTSNYLNLKRAISGHDIAKNYLEPIIYNIVNNPSYTSIAISSTAKIQLLSQLDSLIDYSNDSSIDSTLIHLKLELNYYSNKSIKELSNVIKRK